MRVAALILGTLTVCAAALGAQNAGPPDRAGIDVVNYELTLDLPDTGARIDGRAVLAIRRTAPVDTLRLDLVGLRVDSTLVNGRPTRFARDSATVRIPLPAGSHDSLSVAVRYGGVVTDGLIVRTDSLGRWTGFGDNWPQRARYWIPSVDDPSDKATVTWIVRAPSERRVVANGRLEEESPVAARGTRRTLTRWRESRPIPTYLMAIAAAPLVYYDLGRTACGESEFPGCVRQSVYVAPELRDYLPGPFAQAAGIVEFFASLVAPFPYEKLAHLQSSTRFGGMENASEIFYNGDVIRHRTLDWETIAHETAHQWFGDAVTPESFAHLWLSEGFATYWAQLWLQHTGGDGAFRAAMTKLRREIIASPVSSTRPVLDTAQTDYLKLLNTNSYQKGAWVLHMLRTALGDSAFFGGVRAYYREHRHGNARTDDLRRALERASGTELGWFFDQWLRRPGFVELSTRWSYDRSSRRVTLEVVQGQRFAPFRSPLTLELRDAGGRTRRATVEVAAVRSQRIVLPVELDATPRSLTLDPDVQLLAAFATQ